MEFLKIDSFIFEAIEEFLMKLLRSLSFNRFVFWAEKAECVQAIDARLNCFV